MERSLPLLDEEDIRVGGLIDAQVPVLFGPSSPFDTIQPVQKWMFATGEVWAPLSDLAFQFILDKSGGKSGEWHRPPDPDAPTRAKSRPTPGARGPHRGQR